MSGIQLLLSFVVVTIGWQLVAQAAGPPLARWLYGKRVASIHASGTRFESQEAATAWATRTSTQSMNLALLALAAGCGLVAGLLRFPLIGFSRSTNGWSWLRILTLCGTSWLALFVFHRGGS